MDRKQIGKLGENTAVEYLKKKRHRILARNWQNKWGEIDIVAKRKKRIVFVEVKTLQKTQNFLPEDQINQKKKRQLVKMAQIYLLQNNLPLETPHQIDVIAVELIASEPKIRHLENVLEDIV